MSYAAFRHRAATIPRRMLKYYLARNKSFPAPVRGWVTNANLANAQKGQCLVLENFFPTATGLQLRGGSALHATTGTVPVERCFGYNGVIGNFLFAADATKIFPITSPADPAVAPAASVSGQTSGYYSTALFTNSGGTYLFAVNGTDYLQRFDGAAWLQITGVSTPAITGVDTSTLSAVWVYKGRLFFIAEGSLNLYYLAVDSISGAIGIKSLGGIFQRGGSLLFGATWSRDAGDGLSELCVCVTDNGEVAVFQGNNPAGSAVGDFDIVGRYDISVPMGKNSTIHAGGDLLVMTQDGIVPLSEAFNKDVAALSLSAVTKNIQPDWQQLVRARGGTPWEIVKWPSQTMAVVTVPAPSDGDDKLVLVVNLQTGAWTKYTNWDARSVAVFNDKLYFGNRHGQVLRGEVGGNDLGGNIYYKCVYHADHLDAAGETKTVISARSTFISSLPFALKLSCSVNYIINVPTPPSAVSVAGEGWDLSSWDVGVWDAAALAAVTQTHWVSIGKTGFAHNPQIQITTNSIAHLDTKFVTLDLLYKSGGVMV